MWSLLTVNLDPCHRGTKQQASTPHTNYSLDPCNDESHAVTLLFLFLF